MTAMISDPSTQPLPIIRPWLGEEEVAAVAAVIRSGWVAQGPQVRAFERELADAVGAADGVAVSSCTTGLHLALVAAGVARGDDVVVPSFSFIATTNAPRYVGAVPRFADVDAITGNVTLESVAEALTSRTTAVIVVDQAGVPADIAPLRAELDRRGITLIEDAACAIGSTYDGRLVGRDAAFAVFSFHPRKLVTTGEGGMVLVDDERVASRLRRLREHGMSVSAADRHALGGVVIERYLELGFNYRMTDVQAALGRVQLARLDALVAERRALAAGYHQRLEGVAGVRSVTDPPYGTTNYQSFWVELEDQYPVDRDELMRRFAAVGIATRRGIMAAHLEPACSELSSPVLPVTERLTRRSLILPLFHGMTDADLDRVADVMRGCAR